MRMDTHTQAVLLLTAHLPKGSQTDVSPLKPSEWDRFAGWLRNERKRPEDLLEADDPAPVLHGWHDPDVTRERVFRLLGRAAALGVMLEKWERAGLWVVVRSNPDYPSKLEQRLGQKSPPFLIGCGNVGILKSPAIAVVGSRKASADDLRFTREFGRKVAHEKHIVVSGGARGIDETAMRGCIEAGGRAAGILADSLLRAVTSTKYRDALANDRIVLMTPFNPEVGFYVKNAMARNKYIYCCADAALVVAAGDSSGGTWSGAVEALRAGWVPVWVRTSPQSQDGNAALVRKGAHDLGDRLPTPHELRDAPAVRSSGQAELFNNGSDSKTHSHA